MIQSERAGGQSTRAHKPTDCASAHVLPPSADRVKPRGVPIQMCWPSSTILKTYWWSILPHSESRVVVAPIESVITRQVCPSSHVSFIPSAVAMYVVSPRVTIPPGATYCHSGPSWANSQFFHVLPPSSDNPQPLPTVPYQISPRGPNPNAWTKSHEIACAAVSFDERTCSHLPSPFLNTEIPCPYVPTQAEPSGAGTLASTCAPHPDESGSGAIVCPASGAKQHSDATTHDAPRTISLSAYRWQVADVSPSPQRARVV